VFAEDPVALEVAAPGTRFLHPMSVEVLLTKTGSAVTVTGRIAVPVAFECARCLREFPASLDIPVAAKFMPEPPPPAPGQHAMPEDEAEDYYYRDDVVALDDLVRQEVLLALPFSPQCRPACRGLCGQCGQDLNVGTCACAPPPDSRLAALREYLKKP
jgi:uncharacterized protein